LVEFTQAVLSGCHYLFLLLHTIGAYVAEGHDGGGVSRHRKRYPRRIVERLLARHGNLNAHRAFT
jgi:hypothetical protein